MSGFGIAHRDWADDPRFGKDEIAVLAVLAMHADPTGFCHPSQGLLAQKLKTTRTWVCRVIGRILRLAPDVLIRKRTQGVNHYWLMGHGAVMKVLRKHRPSEDSHVPHGHSGSAASETPDVPAPAHKYDHLSQPSNSPPEVSQEAQETAAQVVRDAELEGPDEQQRVRNVVRHVLGQRLPPWKDRKQVIGVVARLLASGVPVIDTGYRVRLGDPEGKPTLTLRCP